MLTLGQMLQGQMSPGQMFPRHLPTHTDDLTNQSSKFGKVWQSSDQSLTTIINNLHFTEVCARSELRKKWSKTTLLQAIFQLFEFSANNV